MLLSASTTSNSWVAAVIFFVVEVSPVLFIDAQNVSSSVGGPTWINPFRSFPRSRQFSITCCRDGVPEPDPIVKPHLIEWELTYLGNASYDPTCHRYSGQLSLPSGTFQEFEKNLEIRCNCSAPDLDRNCRHLPPCENAGYRSFSINLRCVCPLKWFGELCEKYCSNGELVKNEKRVDQCICEPNYYGDSCDQIVCMNQGTPAYSNRACQCLFGFYGRFCEFSANNSENPFEQRRQQQQSDYFSRDISGTCVSLFLVAALGIAVFVLVRRRTMRLQNALQQLQYAAGSTHAIEHADGRTAVVAPSFAGHAPLTADDGRPGHGTRSLQLTRCHVNSAFSFGPCTDLPPSYLSSIQRSIPEIPLQTLSATESLLLTPPPTYEEAAKSDAPKQANDGEPHEIRSSNECLSGCSSMSNSNFSNSATSANCRASIPPS